MAADEADQCHGAQLRFGRHPGVNKLFLNMWGEQDHSRQYCNLLSSA